MAPRPGTTLNHRSGTAVLRDLKARLVREELAVHPEFQSSQELTEAAPPTRRGVEK